jgi:multidrug resistance efflux pump
VKAPYAGTVGQVSVRNGEFVAPGQPLIIMGDLKTLWVETTDLNEIDVGQIEEGQTVVLTFDALPDHIINGKITRISPMAEPGGLGVNYTAIIEMETVPLDVRWGMTAFVDIEIDSE